MVVGLSMRADGRVEWNCSHGCGHTVFAPKVKQDDGTFAQNYIHGCDGCCSSPEFKKIKNINKEAQKMYKDYLKRKKGMNNIERFLMEMF